MSAQPIDMRPDHEALVRDILLARLPKGVRVWVFGSRAKWLAKPYSDLDLALEAADCLPDALIADLKDDFRESDLPWKVDVLDLNAIAPSFRALIDEDRIGFLLREEWRKINFLDAPIEIIDGDRGVNYPKQIDFTSKEYCLFLNAGNVSPSGFNFSDCAFINKERDNLLRKGKLERFDSVLTTRGTVGNVAFFDNSVQFDHIRINSGMIIFRPDQSAIVPRFLYLFLRSGLFKNQVSALTTGSAQPQLPIRDIRRIHMPILSLPEQRAIASILGSLDDKIDLNRRMNETLETMARAIFKDWFVDFGPTRAKMEGREPYLAPEIWQLFPEKLGEDGVPVGWEMGTLVDCVHKIQNGGTPKRSDDVYWEGGKVPWLTSGEVRKDIVIETQNFITEVGLQCSSAKMLPAMIPLVALYGATAGQVTLSAIPLSTNQAISAVIPQDEYRYYALIHLKREVEKLANSAVGSAQQNISKKIVEELSTLVPGENCAIAFEDCVAPLFERAVRNLEESHTLAQTRDLLLPKLMSGEIRVREAEKLVEEVV